MKSLFLILLATIYCANAQEGGMVFIKGTTTTDTIHEKTVGYLKIKLTRVSCAEFGGVFFSHRSGIAMGITGITPDVRKDLFCLASEEERLTFFFDSDSTSELQGSVIDQPLHLGFVPIRGLHEFQFHPMLFSAQSPNPKGSNYISNVLNDTNKVNPIPTAQPYLKMAAFSLDFLVETFNLNASKYYINAPTHALNIFAVPDNDSINQLQSGRYLIYGSKFSKYFERNSVRETYNIQNDWHVQDANWNFKAKGLELNSIPIKENLPYIIIQIAVIDTLLVPGEIELRHSVGPSYLGEGSDYANVKKHFLNGKAELESVGSYESWKVASALEKANVSYLALNAHLEANKKYFNNTDSTSLRNKTAGVMIQQTRDFINPSDLPNLLKEEDMKGKWKEVYQLQLIKDAVNSLKKEPKENQKNVWLLEGLKLLKPVS